MGKLENCAMRALTLFFAFAFVAFAQQSSKGWSFRLPDGTYVAFISSARMVPGPTRGSSYHMPDLTGNARLLDNAIEHVIEEYGQKLLAYRLRIEPAGDVAYVVKIEPVPGAPFFLQAPKPLQILDGQRAEIDLATSKDGYVKAVGSIQVTKYYRRLSFIPASRAELRDLTLDALQLTVSEAQVFKNNIRIAEDAGGGTGSPLVAYLPRVGRVFFTLLPTKDFNFTTAVVENNRIIFDVGSDHYEITSNTSVIGQPGRWKIYMLRALDTTPCDQSVDSSKPSVWAQGGLSSENLNCQGQ